ncbi:polysaccharide deacetylase family protein [Mesorhizobium australafricanum]|uniref:Chitooligosaccharide deacetylase n=1 Tax=Mesorhizobium australafricanum TaxID=3072311 RepID=A0ABU4X5W6_9HYPH|nr:polysaccharide deacetylase family protein [Mesorhizobium sp. VK3E]MDX8443449.1 polysaccharide deacetylase family protein [Mesorhizobium sp. VK3E]
MDFLVSLAYRVWWRLRDLVLPPKPAESFAGRILCVGTADDIRLKHREIVLTFDDGPLRGQTETILRALEEAGVKATFMMVGTQARGHPDIVRMIAEGGHTIGSHTEYHLNLTKVDLVTATTEIEQGHANVATPLQSTRYVAAPFFRFPFLAETPRLRSEIAKRNLIVLDVDINVGDDADLSPPQLRAKALKRIVGRGSGIVLLHDIHDRTAAMLPGLLADIKARGFTVAHLVPS